MKIAICDDDKQLHDDLYQILVSCEILPKSAIIRKFSSGIELVESYQKQCFDLIFLDIEMPELSGLETGKKIRKMDRNVIIVFLTSFQNYVFHSFRIEAFDYLIKPPKAHEIKQLLTRVVSKYLALHYLLNLKWKDRVFVCLLDYSSNPAVRYCSDYSTSQAGTCSLFSGHSRTYHKHTGFYSPRVKPCWD